ncbi:SagB/ThcOx family dehydrogenase [Streptomyces monticola]|uniref:SagB/ThcOx family dehydrogenase n=1 Tax=Streptomyces monticola TaxID=2666263 RepID=A0ABW2JMR3_9ACTN
MDLVSALARARSAEPPGPDTPAGPATPAWPGLPRPVPQAGRGELDLEMLLRLSLAASDGGGRLRPAPSAGGLHPVDAQLVVGSNCPLPSGCYGYDPLRHRVHRLGPAPEAAPGVRVELSVTAQRTLSHYGHRAWPLLLLDTGHAAAALWLAARALGCDPSGLRFDTYDGGAALDGDASLHGGASLDGGSLVAGDGAPHAARDSRLLAPRDSCALAAVHITPPPAVRPATEAPAPRELLARRSAPTPLPHRAPSEEALRAVLATAVEASSGALAWCAATGEPRPGLVELGHDGTLRTLAAGEARPTLAVWAAGQAWIADAGAVLLGHGCPADAPAQQIRRTHLRAGFAVGLAQLTAARHGLAARPVGSWQQADLGAALGTTPGRDWIVHGLALGTDHPKEGTS